MDAQKLSYFQKNLNDPDGQKRRLSIETLDIQEIDDSLLRLLVQKLEDENKGVRDASFQKLKGTNNPLLPQLLVPFFFYRDLEVKNLAVDLMVGFGDEATPQLIELLHSTDPDAQKSSAEVITILKPHGAVDALLEHLDDPDPNVSFACIEALGAIRDFKAVEPLIDVFKNSDDLREVSIEALGNILSRRVPETLINAIYNDDPMIVFSVLDALGKIGEPRALDILLEIFPNSDELIQTEILKAAGQIIQSSRYFILPDFLMDVVKNIFDDEDLNEKKYLLQLISRINSFETLHFILEAYQISEEESWQTDIFSILVNFLSLFPEHGVKYLLENKDVEMQVWFISHFPHTKNKVLFNFLVQLLNDNTKDISIQQSALYYAAMFETAEAQELINKKLNENNWENIELIIQALCNIKIKPYISSLILLLQKSTKEIQQQILELFNSQTSEIIQEEITRNFSKFSDYLKLSCLPLLPNLLAENIPLVKNALKTENLNNVELAMEIIDKTPDSFDSSCITQLINNKNTELIPKVIKLLGTHWPDKFEEEIKKHLSDSTTISTFLSNALELDIDLSLEFLDEMSTKIEKESKPILRQIIINTGNENLYKKIIKELGNESDDEIEYYLEIAQSNDKRVFIEQLLNNLENHQELKNKYSSFLTNEI